MLLPNLTKSKISEESWQCNNDNNCFGHEVAESKNLRPQEVPACLVRPVEDGFCGHRCSCCKEDYSSYSCSLPPTDGWSSRCFVWRQPLWCKQWRLVPETSWIQGKWRPDMLLLWSGAASAGGSIFGGGGGIRARNQQGTTSKSHRHPNGLWRNFPNCRSSQLWWQPFRGSRRLASAAIVTACWNALKYTGKMWCV